jgi:hypothetical protein
VRGRWCYADELRPEVGCATPRTFEASAWLAFGDAYDGAEPYASVDSPVQAIYRRVYGAALFGAGGGPDGPTLPVPAPGPAAPSAPGPADAGAGGGAAGAGGAVPACDCSCAFLDEIERLTESIAPGGAPPPALVGQLQCLMTCAPQFAACGD